MTQQAAEAGRPSFYHYFGALALFVLLAQVVTGAYMAMYYQPIPEQAWAGIEYIENKLFLGNFMRSAHRWGAFLLAAFVILHVLRVIFHGAYRKPRRMVWISGLVLTLAVMGVILSGYLLPWDFRAYWVSLNVKNWLATLPLGGGLLHWFFFADSPGNLVPLNRWYAMHVMALPFLAAAFTVWHLWQVKKQGLAVGNGERAVPWPGPLRRLAALWVVEAVAFGLLAQFGTQKVVMADPITTSSIPQPDWLFMLFFQVTRYCQDGMEMLGVFWIPLLLLLFLLLLPLLDRAPRRLRLLKWGTALGSLAAVVLVLVVTFHTCSTTPIWSCAACHKADFGEGFAIPPTKLDDFSDRYDTKWLSLHYRYPQFYWMMDAEVPKW